MNTKKFKVKWMLIWKIATGKYKHVVFLALDEANFIECVKQSCLNNGEIKQVDVGFYGMREIQSMLTIRAAAATIREGDLIAAEIENKVDIDVHLDKKLKKKL